MAEQKAGLARLSTGVSGLDQIVRGGFLRGGVYIVSGPPGSGKTIFGNQLCFSQAREGKHALFLTLLAESHGRMVRHLEGFSFFVPEEVDRSVFYVSGYHALKAGGLHALSRLMRQQVREKRPSVLVLDGLQAAEEAATSKLEYREFLHELGVHNALVGCTTVVLTTEEGGSANDPEFAMVDGTIRFTNELYGLKAIRGLEVAKFRGAAQLPGKHTFLIDDHGVNAFPRTEALYTQVPTTVPDPKKRKAFGIPSLDAMLHGGLVADSCTLMLGSPGVGKTTLGLAFLAEGAARGERGLYYGFAESVPRLLQKSELLELGLGPHVKAGRIHLEARAALETVPDALVQDLFARIEREKITAAVRRRARAVLPRGPRSRADVALRRRAHERAPGAQGHLAHDPADELAREHRAVRADAGRRGDLRQHPVPALPRAPRRARPAAPGDEDARQRQRPRDAEAGDRSRQNRGRRALHRLRGPAHRPGALLGPHRALRTTEAETGEVDVGSGERRTTRRRR